jgi:preprotein translocase subunit SecE
MTEFIIVVVFVSVAYAAMALLGYLMAKGL